MSTEELKQSRHLSVLGKWVLPDDVGCADLALGMCIDLRDIMVSVKNQNHNFMINPAKSYVRSLSASVFEECDNDMELRRLTMEVLGESGWRVKLDTSSVILKCGMGQLVASITFGVQDNPIFNMFPLARMKLPDRTNFVFELGQCKESYDYYLVGSIWLSPTSIVLSNV